VRLLLGAALLILGAVYQTSPAQGAYTLTLEISDSLGNSTPVGGITTGPFTTVGANTFIDAGAFFPEFTSLLISASGSQTAATSQIAKVDISGAVLSGAGTVDLFVRLTGSGFTMPTVTVTAIQSIANSSVPGAFDTYSLTGTLGGTTVASQSISGAAASSFSTTKPGIPLAGAYTAVLDQSITNISNILTLGATLAWTTGGGGGAVPVPPTMVLALTGVIGIGLSRLRRFRWKDFA